MWDGRCALNWESWSGWGWGITPSRYQQCQSEASLLLPLALSCPCTACPLPAAALTGSLPGTHALCPRRGGTHTCSGPRARFCCSACCLHPLLSFLGMGVWGGCFSGQRGAEGTRWSKARFLRVCLCVHSQSSSAWRAHRPAWRWTPLACLKGLDF